MFGVLLLLVAVQNPWVATPPRAAPAGTHRPASASRTTTSVPRPRLNIDLSGLSDDDAVVAASRSRSSAPAAATRPDRQLVWSPRLNGIAAQGAAPVPQPLATLAVAPGFDDDTPDQIDPAVADLIGSVQLPMIGSAPRARTALPVASRSLASAPSPGPRRYEPGRW